MSRMTYVLGLDQSYTGFGVSKQYSGSNDHVTYKKGFPLKGGDPSLRLMRIRNWFMGELPLTKKPNLAVMEGYANGAKFGREVAGELGGVIKLCLVDLGIPFIIVPPTTLKKFVTGSGAAKKNVILQKVYKRWGVEFSDDNEADAYSLAKFGFVYLGQEIGPMTKPMQEAFDKFLKEHPKSP